MERYEVFAGETVVGNAELIREGLFYRIRCRCRLPADSMYRLQMTAGDIHRDLGICVPVDGVFGVDTKVSVKLLGAEPRRFSVTDSQKGTERATLEVCAGKPFAFLDRLETARAEVVNGDLRVVIDD